MPCSGKTTVCQMLAMMRSQKLHMLNCNQHTEASDFLGGFRPLRNRSTAHAAIQKAVKAVADSWLVKLAEVTQMVVILSDDEVRDISSSKVEMLLQNIQKVVAEVVAWSNGQQQQYESCSVEQEVQHLKQIVASAESAAAVLRAPFQWVDGPLVTAMRQGDMILVDEINLAEDAVLERLNR